MIHIYLQLPLAFLLIPHRLADFVFELDILHAIIFVCHPFPILMNLRG